MDQRKTKAFFEGRDIHAYNIFGAHLEANGVRFRVYAPNAKNISVIGTFNDWDDQASKMKKDKYVGICKVGEKGQIVIPKDGRDMFNIKPGDSIIVLCDKDKGIALVKSDVIENIGDDILGGKNGK